MILYLTLLLLYRVLFFYYIIFFHYEVRIFIWVINFFFQDMSHLSKFEQTGLLRGGRKISLKDFMDLVSSVFHKHKYVTLLSSTCNPFDFASPSSTLTSKKALLMWKHTLIFV